MVFRYSDPAMDAEAYQTHLTASRRMFERENYRGDCPYCGKPMYDEAYDWEENCKYDEELGDFAHEYCAWKAQEDREEETCTA